MVEYGYLVASVVVSTIIALAVYAMVLEHVRRVYRLFSTSLSKEQPKKPPQSPTGTNSSSEFPAMTTKVRSQTLNSFRKHQRALSSELSDDMIKKSTLSKIFCWMFILSSVIRATVRMYLDLDSFHLTPMAAHCPSALKCLAVFLALTKSSLYGVFISRIDMAYHQTMYSYSDRTIRLLYLITVVNLIIFLIWLPFGIKADNNNEKMEISVNGETLSPESNEKRMRTYYPIASMYLALYSVIYDMSFMVILVAMFVRPLRHLYLMQMNHNNNRNESESFRKIPITNNCNSNIQLSAQDIARLEIRLLPIKFTLLSLVAVMTTLIGIIILGLGYNIVLILDIPVNVACLLLMSSKYWGCEYWLLCSPLLLSLHNSWINLVDDDTHDYIKLMSEHFDHLRLNKRMDQLTIVRRVLNLNELKVTITQE